MDEWVPKSRIRLVYIFIIFVFFFLILNSNFNIFQTDKIIEEEPEIKKNQKIEAKKSEFEENDEHEGKY